MEAKRSRNFSKQELEVLVEEVAGRKILLLGKFDNMGVTAENKKRGWARVAQSVSSVGGFSRDAEAVKKKWADIKSLAKKKGAERAREQGKTGGGVCTIHLDPIEEKIVSIIGERSVTGEEGGLDTGAATDNNEDSVVFLYDVPADPIQSFATQVPNSEEQENPDDVLSFSGVLPDITVNNKTEEMLSLQAEILQELSALRRVQEQLLEVEKQKLAIAKEKLELKKKRILK
ncbi:nuclear apoptosis-inducing factor 1-like [Odontesthes bonariensis]|uniref:nuclear apoptosis-inducing factor 1-like n=1 Tax=Odontesthes bonariensis TaxID=219752 RepID=UPI003F5828C5